MAPDANLIYYIKERKEKKIEDTRNLFLNQDKRSKQKYN